MKKVILIGLLILSTLLLPKSEQTYFTHTPNITVDDELLPYFNKVVNDIIKAGVRINLDQPITIKLADDHPKGIIGIAHGMFDHNRVEITISRKYWDSFRRSERLWVMIHEMGHDFWFVFHHGDGIMRPYHKGGETMVTYNQAFDELMKTLKGIQNG